MGWGLSKFPQHRSGTAQNACFKHKRKKPHGRPVLGSAENMNWSQGIKIWIGDLKGDFDIQNLGFTNMEVKIRDGSGWKGVSYISIYYNILFKQPNLQSTTWSGFYASLLHRFKHVTYIWNTYTLGCTSEQEHGGGGLNRQNYEIQQQILWMLKTR
jgi:hypothetical protein